MKTLQSAEIARQVCIRKLKSFLIKPTDKDAELLKKDPAISIQFELYEQWKNRKRNIEKWMEEHVEQNF